MKQLDFLTRPTSDRLKREIENICDSYSHTWDIVAELAQNSVDAIRLHIKKHGQEARQHFIELEIDSQNRSISIKDSGVGFSGEIEKVMNLLAPHGSNKNPADQDVIGQKGVGLTYVIFVSNYFELKSRSVDSYVEAVVQNATLWKSGKTSDLPLLDVKQQNSEKNSPSETFTQLTIKDIDQIYSEQDDLFCQTLPIIQYILRTKTAIGSTMAVFDKDNPLKIDVTLTHIDINGKRKTQKVKFEYMLPEDFINLSSYIDLDEFVSLAAALDDRQKTQKLRGKCLRKVGSITRYGRTIKFYAFFAPSRLFWKDISEKNELIKISNEQEEFESLYKGGIFVSTRGMPTGVELTPPVTGYAGYWPNFYILIEDNSIVFDLGRKSIPGRTQGLLKEIAKGLFSDSIKFAQYISSDPSVKQAIPTVQQFEKNQYFEELKTLPDLGILKLHYLKHPDEQEAAVTALFNQLIQGEFLKGYYVLRMGFKMTYDLWGMYEMSKSYVGRAFHKQIKKDGERIPVVIEFKYKAEDILIDFENNIKFFTDIDLLVCWDLDEKRLSKSGVEVSVINESDAFFHGTNYELVWSGAYNLGSASKKPVIALRKFIEGLNK